VQHASIPPNGSPIARATYSLAELAALLDVSYMTAQEMAQAGTLPVTPIRIGRQYRFPKSTVDQLLCVHVEASHEAA